MHRQNRFALLPVGMISLWTAALSVASCNCPGYIGTFDGGIFPDSGQPDLIIDPADIGLPCEYDPTTRENPTNQCPAGLSCIIVTFDGEFNSGMGLSVWEDHFTVYREDNIDVGFCSLQGTWSAPPFCPAGTELKLLFPNTAICVKSCESADDCGRTDYTCDQRFLDLQAPACVRKCVLDVPDCVRSGELLRQDGQTIAMHLALQDLSGESVCNQNLGVCGSNVVHGNKGPGQECTRTSECVSGTVCLQGPVLGGDLNDPGFCGLPCKPDPQSPAGSCPTGFLCQAGFTFGHGNPLDQNLQDNNGFLMVNLDNNSGFEAGGYCFANCQDNGGDCTAFPGTSCGKADQNVFGFTWNGASMCLPDALRTGN